MLKTNNIFVKTYRDGIKISLNIGWLLFYLHYLCYGYFGALSFSQDYYSRRPILSIAITSFIFISQIILGLAAHKYTNFFTQKIKINWNHICIFLIILVFNIALTWERLSLNLFSDEIANSQFAHLHAIEISRIIYEKFPLFGSLKAKSLIQGVSLVLLISQLSFIYLSSRLHLIYRIFTVSFIILIFKLIYLHFGGYLSPQPPLHQLSPFIFGSFFGLSDFPLRLSYTFPYVLGMSIIFFKLKTILNTFNTFTCVLAINTLPIALNMSTEIISSLWAYLAFSIYLIFYSIDIESKEKLNIYLISIFTMFRQTAIFTFIPIFLKSFQDKRNIPPIKEILIYLIPIILFLNYFIFAIINGSAAIEDLDSVKPLERINVIKQIFTTNITFNFISQSVDFWWIIFFPFAFIKKNTRNRYGINNNHLIFFFFLLLFFHSIKPIYWYYSKYRFEYFVPFCVAGFIRFVMILINLFKAKSNLWIGILSVVLILANLSSHKSYIYRHNLIFRTDQIERNNKFFVEKSFASYPLPLEQAYEFIKNNDYAGKTYILGPTYGVFSDIIHGLSIQEVNNALSIFKSYEYQKLNSYNDLNFITQNNDIKAILVPSINNNEGLEFSGWLRKAKFYDKRYSSSITIYTRED